MKLWYCTDNLLLIVFLGFCALITNIVWHFFEPCTQKYTIETNNVDISSVVDSVLTYSESSLMLCKDGVCYSLSVENINGNVYIYGLNYVADSIVSGNLYRGRNVAEIMQIETLFEKLILSKLGKWEKHYLQGFSSFLAIKSIDYYIFKWFGYYIIIIFLYLLLKKILRSASVKG